MSIAWRARVVIGEAAEDGKESSKTAKATGIEKNILFRLHSRSETKQKGLVPFGR